MGTGINRGSYWRKYQCLIEFKSSLPITEKLITFALIENLQKHWKDWIGYLKLCIQHNTELTLNPVHLSSCPWKGNHVILLFLYFFEGGGGGGS